MVKSPEFHPVGPGSIPGADLFQECSKSQTFSKFCEKSLNQQLLFYYSIRRGSVVHCSDSSFKQVIASLNAESLARKFEFMHTRIGEMMQKLKSYSTIQIQTLVLLSQKLGKIGPLGRFLATLKNSKLKFGRMELSGSLHIAQQIKCQVYRLRALFCCRLNYLKINSKSKTYCKA